jgi:hypothetical protein
VKRLILALLAALSLPVMADSINLNSSRSNPPAADRVQSIDRQLDTNATDKHLKIRDLTSGNAAEYKDGEDGVNHDKAITFGRDHLNNAAPAADNQRDIRGKGKLPGFERLAGKPSKDQIVEPAESTTIKGSKSNGSERLKQLDGRTSKSFGGSDAVPEVDQAITVRGSKSNSSERLILNTNPTSKTTVKGSKSNGDNRVGDAVPDGCKPNEFCASGQHFPQPLKK